MKRIVFLCSVAAAALTACTPSASYTVSGIVPDNTYNGKTVYMVDEALSKAVDSAVVADGKFTFTGSIDTAVTRFLQIDRKMHADIILENGKIATDLSKHFNPSGTPLNDALTDFNMQIGKIISIEKPKLMEIQKNADATDAEKSKLMNDWYNSYKVQYMQVARKVFSENTNNALGVYLISNSESLASIEQMDSLYAQAGNIVKNSILVKKVIAHNDKLRNTVVGKHFADFTVEHGNIDGSKASLSDYVGKGKYVLVDFWASWCGPCLAETPNIAEVYNKYKGDHFEVLGVAAFDKRENTLKCMKEHNITWPLIIDAQTIPADVYGINSIPQIMLFSPDGTIIARDLRGDGIKQKIAEVMAEFKN